MASGLGDAAARARASGRAPEDRRGVLLVEASAGTGKTTVLLERVVAILEAGEERLSRIAVVTFTEAAAAELRSRLGQRLQRQASAAAWATRSLRELGGAPIGTLHGLCANLLRGRPQVAGVPPGFAIAGPFERRQLERRAWEELLRSAPPSPEVLDAADELGLGEERLLRRAALRLIGRSGSGLPSPLPAGVIAAEARLAEVDRLLCEAEAQADEPWAAVVGDARLELAALARLSVEAWQGELVRHGAPKAFAARRRVRSSRRGAPRLFATARQRIEALAADLVHQRLAVVAGWLAGVDSCYTSLLGQAGAVDFDMLVRKAVELLDDPAARAAAHRRYPVVLVDELQDTDADQCELIRRLTTPVEGRSGGLRSLVLVGDPKQSIYRFRGADLESYHRLAEELAGGSATVRLSHSFRPTPALASWVNRAMGDVLAGASAPWEARYAPLDAVAAGEVPPVTGALVVELALPATSGAVVRRAEAAALASAAARLVGSERPTSVRGRDGRLRPATWGDMALLLPRLSEVGVYRDALSEVAVPHQVVGGARLARPEVAALLALLRAVADPADSVAAVAALRGPPYGCSDRGLASLALAGGRLDLAARHRDSVLAAAPDREAAAQALLGLEQLAELSARVSGPALDRAVSLLIEESGLGLLCSQGAFGNAGMDRLDRVRLLVGQLAPAAGGSLLEGHRALAGALEEDDDVVCEEDDAVRVLTIHRSKGLEFPIVLLGGLGDGPVRGRGLRVLPRRGGGVALALTRRLASHGAAAAIAREAERSVAESKRLLYVAVTRARDLLVLPHVPGYRSRSPVFEPLCRSGALAPGAPGVAARWRQPASSVGPCRESPQAGPLGPAADRLSSDAALAGLRPRDRRWTDGAGTTLELLLAGVDVEQLGGGEAHRLAALLATPLGQRARAAPERLLGVSLPVGDRQKDAMVRVDLAFRQVSGWAVVSLADPPPGQAREQLERSCAAVSALTGEDVIESVLWDRCALSRSFVPRPPGS